MRAIGFAVISAFAVGCGQSDRHPVSGTVRIGTQPIRGGYVIFEPVGQGVAGPQGYAPIRDGKFDTRDSGEAAAAGPSIVRIQGWGQPSERFPNGVPVCTAYETRVELQAKANTLELTVPESARVKEPKEGWGTPP